MPSRVGPQDVPIVIKFGGGIHSRPSEDEIHEQECVEGRNFILDLEDTGFRNRPPFDLIGTVGNAAEIRGLVTHLKTDGTATALVQAGDTVYEWDGATTFTSRGTVPATAQLRGRLEHNFQLDDKVIITDLNSVEEILEWDGTTLAKTAMLDSGGTAFGDFRAKYCFVSNERVFYANIVDASSTPITLPHLIVGAKRGEFETISVNDRPSSALSEGDPFFLIQPDFHPINGMVESFGKAVTSSLRGSAFKLTGASAKDFAFEELYPRSGATGDEAVAYVGNDILIGRQGRIESLSGVEQFGDVENDDLTVGISDSIDTYNDWVLTYNSRTQKIYCYPDSKSEIWVLHKSLVGSGVSPWSRYVTDHAMAFDPTAIMNMLDPSDGLEYVFFGDASGNFYRMEGTGSGDGGTTDVDVERLSKLYAFPEGAQAYNIEGYISYRASLTARSVRLRFEFSGESVFDSQITVNLPATTQGQVTYGGGFYYSGGKYYGATFSGRLTRQKFGVAGKSNSFQVRATVSESTDFDIKEIGLKLTAAS